MEIEPLTKRLIGVNLYTNLEPAGSFPNGFERPAHFQARTKTRWSSYGFIQEIPERRTPPFQWIDETVTDAILHLSVLPTAGWDKVTERDLLDLAQRCSSFNLNGRSVMLLFAPEMNSPYHIWGMQPGAFLKNWNILASMLDSLPDASRTAMVWAPFDGTNYPLNGTYSARRGTEDYAILDTNTDGVLDHNDDPYKPYLPVNTSTIDWIGLSVYWKNQSIPTDTALKDTLNGANDKPGFYTTFESINKPMLLSTASVYIKDLNSPSNLSLEADMKSVWWKSWLVDQSFKEAFPRIKMICLAESLVGRKNLSYNSAISNRSDILQSFLKDLGTESNTISWSRSANLTTWTGPYFPILPDATNGSAAASLTVTLIVLGVLGIPIVALSLWICIAIHRHVRSTKRKQERSLRTANSTCYSESVRSYDSQITSSDADFDTYSDCEESVYVVRESGSVTTC